MNTQQLNAIQELLNEAHRLRLENKAAGRKIESAACAIRERAIQDVLDAIQSEIGRK